MAIFLQRCHVHAIAGWDKTSSEMPVAHTESRLSVITKYCDAIIVDVIKAKQTEIDSIVISRVLNIWGVLPFLWWLGRVKWAWRQRFSSAWLHNDRVAAQSGTLEPQNTYSPFTGPSTGGVEARDSDKRCRFENKHFFNSAASAPSADSRQPPIDPRNTCFWMERWISYGKYDTVTQTVGPIEKSEKSVKMEELKRIATITA